MSVAVGSPTFPRPEYSFQDSGLKFGQAVRSGRQSKSVSFFWNACKAP